MRKTILKPWHQTPSIWSNLVYENLNYLFAIQSGYYGYLFSGNSTMIRDIAVRVLPYWNKLHSFFRFLEVIFLYDNLYDLATNYAVDPLSLNHGNAWAVHARAHCFEMTIQTSKGVNFMKSHEKSRDKARMLGGHNY